MVVRFSESDEKVKPEAAKANGPVRTASRQIRMQRKSDCAHTQQEEDELDLGCGREEQGKELNMSQLHGEAKISLGDDGAK